MPHVYWQAKAARSNLFRFQPMIVYAADTGSTTVTFPMCAFGMAMQKYTTLLCTPALAECMAGLDGRECVHESHDEVAYGPDGAAKRSGEYPPRFCSLLAAVLTDPSATPQALAIEMVAAAVDTSGPPFGTTAVDTSGPPFGATPLEGPGLELAPAPVRRTGLLGGAPRSRNHDILMVGNQVRKLHRGGVAVIYVVDGVDDAQRHAYIVIPVGETTRKRTDLDPRMMVGERDALVRPEQWQLLPGGRSIFPASEKSFVCSVCYAESNHAPCAMCNGRTDGGHVMVVQNLPVVVLDGYAVDAPQGDAAVARAAQSDAGRAQVEYAARPPRVAGDAVVREGGISFAYLVHADGRTPGPREAATTAPGYAYPADPGWADEADLSDIEDDVSEAGVGGVVMAYRSAVKGGRPHGGMPRLSTEAASSAFLPRRTAVTVAKVAVKSKVRFSVQDGVERRHAIPNTFEEAMVHEDCAAIWSAILREMDAQEDCRTWEQRPACECYDQGLSPIDNRWVFDCKIDQTSRCMIMWKARIVARGDQMVKLRDYFETYAGVCRHATFRLFLAVAALWGLVLTGADVSTAYLHAPLRDCQVWMKAPRGFPALARMLDGSPALLRLRMALYGLRQSAREWATTLREWLLSWEGGTFSRMEADGYVYLWRTPQGMLLLLLWVDDIFMAHSCDAMRASFMAAFSVRFRVKDLGLLRQGLGADIQQDLVAGTVSFSLERYIGDAARRFDLHVDNQWADIPVPLAQARDCRAARPTPTEIEEHDEACRVMTGITVHVATFARPDLAFASQLLSSLKSGPAKQKLCRRVLGYLAKTAALRITYRRDARGAQQAQAYGDELASEDGKVHMPVDADHGDARSVTGWLFMIAGAAASWGARMQPLPSLSSTEAELYGLSSAVCDLLTCTNVLEEWGYVMAGPVTVFCDSRGARLLAVDCAVPARTRHIHRRWFFVRYHSDTGKLTIKEIKGVNNPANFMTKAVGGAASCRDRNYALGMQ